MMTVPEGLRRTGRMMAPRVLIAAAVLVLLSAAGASASSANEVRAMAAACAKARGLPPATYLAACQRARRSYDSYIAEMTQLAGDNRLLLQTSRQIVGDAYAEITNDLSHAQSLQADALRQQNAAARLAADRTRLAREKADMATNADRDRRIQDARARGPDYAAQSGVVFAFSNAPDEMSDTTAFKAVSRQPANAGIVATVTGACTAAHGISFAAAFLDSKGKPSIRFADRRRGGPIKAGYRLDDEPARTVAIAPTKFTNEFRLADLPKAELEAHWRLLYRVDTTRGEALVKLPLFDPAIRQLIQACAH